VKRNFEVVVGPCIAC